MSTEQQGYDISLEAQSDLSTYQYHVMAGSGVDGCDLAGAADEDSVGILQNKPEEEQSAEIRRVGISKAVCGGAIPVWSQVTPDADGHVVVATSGQRYVGLAQQVGATDRVISVLMEFGEA